VGGNERGGGKEEGVHLTIQLHHLLISQIPVFFPKEALR